MKKAGLSVCAALLAASIAGGAAANETRSAASQEPELIGMLQLSDTQMDQVAAGAPSSVAGGMASVLLGSAWSWSRAGTYESGPLRSTTASSLNVAIGIGPTATAYASSTF